MHITIILKIENLHSIKIKSLSKIKLKKYFIVKTGYRMVKPLLDKQDIKLYLLIVNRDFKVDSKNLKWCTDFTYIHSSNGKMLYNCYILDLYYRSVVASKSSSNITAELAIKTLTEALKTHKPNNGLILHSDQGSQYTSKSFTSFCKSNQIYQLMSKSRCDYDNAPMESFYGKFKSEHINHYTIKNILHLDELSNDYIFRYYNHKRPHSSLGGLTPFKRDIHRNNLV